MTTADNLDTSTTEGLDAWFTLDGPQTPSVLPDRPEPPASAVTPPAQATHVQPPLLPSAQWKAETCQLVNWGGFNGRHTFTFAPGVTLISGASGTGKSTLLDAYIALMMPSDTPFNGASNDAVAGRARSGGQRNLVTYLRGKTDTTSDDGREVDKVLRGDKCATWGAIGMTFVSNDGQRFTALRVYYLPGAATAPAAKPTMRMATYDGSLDLSLLEALVGSGAEQSQKFAPRTLKDAFSGMRTYETYSTFAQALHTRLGIGANGDGEKALRLLVRIQAGHQIRTVDDLYKEMVLERPITYAAADRAIEHFDDLEAAYAAMVTEQHKAELLAPITAAHDSLTQATAKLATLDALGVNEPASSATPIALWRLRTHARLLDLAVADNRTQRASAAARLETARGDEQQANEELARYRQAHRDAGGGTVEQLDRGIESLGHEHRRRFDRRTRLLEDTAILAAPLSTRSDHEALLQAAAAFLDGHAGVQAALRTERDDLRDQVGPLMSEKSKLRAERESLIGRQGRVPKDLDDNRRVMAQAAGIDPADLPFVAELIDVHPDETRWRTAIETVLYGTARKMLVPLELLDAFSAAIDAVQLRGRITFEGAERAPHAEVIGDRRYIAGKLLYKDSPYSRWVSEHLSSRTRNALCVETVAQLSGSDLQVTPSGQTRQGRRGAHGQHNARYVIGFSNEDAIAELARAEKALEETLATLDAQIRSVEEREASLRDRHAAYTAATRSTWVDIDTDGVTDQITQLRAHRDALLSGDSKLKELSDAIAGLEDALRRDLTPSRVRLEDRVKELADEHRRLVDAQDKVTGEIDRIEYTTGVVLTDEAATMLDAELRAAVAPADPDRLADLDDNMGRLLRRLRSSQEASRTEQARARDELVRIFEQYQTRWEDPNLGTGVASYPEYAEILENIRRTGLAERRAEWRRRLTEWSGEDLVPLAHAMHSAIEEIEDRLVPINAILAGLPFGAGADRLSIKLRRLSPVTVTAFARELRELAGGATREVPEAETERRFKALQAFMAKIRKKDDVRLNPELRASWDRDNLLDVRRHVEITAERHSVDGQLLSTHASLGGKSGGESQELVAFIVGAALRYRLGDELRERPRFAPVFLDEGFIKSDSEFAGRAVQAWKGLGFQLIIGAPLDKVSALEPHADEILVISKNTATSLSQVFRLHDAPAQQPSGHTA